MRIVAAGQPCIPGESDSETDSDGIREMAQWYTSLNVPCPLLTGECCSVYPLRPTACREHLVTSKPVFCAGNDPTTGSLLDTPFSVTVALATLASEMENMPLESVIMTTALNWCDENTTRTQRTWPVQTLVTRFADIIRRMADHAGTLRQAGHHAA